MLYIPVWNKKPMYSLWGIWVKQHEGSVRIKQGYSTYYMRHWLRLLQHSQSCHHTLCPSPCCILEALIITIPLFQHSCSHELDQDLQLSYHMCSHYLFAGANDDLFPVIDCYEVWFIWWTFMKYRNLTSIPCCFCIVLLFHECCCNFFPEHRVLFTSGFEGLAMWWWLE